MGHGKKYQILIIDDEAQILTLFYSLLNDVSHDVVTCMNLDEGLQQAYQIKPDLVILDEALAIEGGVFRSESILPGRGVPVVLLRDPSFTDGAVLPGNVQLVINKPFELSKTLKAIEGVLENSIAEKELT